MLQIAISVMVGFAIGWFIHHLKHQADFRIWMFRDRVFPVGDLDWRAAKRNSWILRSALRQREEDLRNGGPNFILNEKDGSWNNCVSDRDPQSESLMRVLAKLNLRMLLYEGDYRDPVLVKYLKKNGITLCLIAMTIATMAVVIVHRASRFMNYSNLQAAMPQMAN